MGSTAVRLVAFLALAAVCRGDSAIPSNGGIAYGTGATGAGAYYPWSAINIAPFEVFYNSNLCFYFNQSTACPPNYLNQTGKIYVKPPLVEQFCSPGCLNVQFDQTLQCICKVNKVANVTDPMLFKFTNGATVGQLYNTVHQACSNVTAGLPGNFTVPVVKK